MKSLYISDLDGTLLNERAELPKASLEALNELIDKGLNFTVATARTAVTVTRILDGLRLSLPVILMNGVCIYDIVKREYIKYHIINKESLNRLFSLAGKYDLSSFVYTIFDGDLTVFYEKVTSPLAKAFMEERRNKYGKNFEQVKTYYRLDFDNIIYFTVSDNEKKLLPLYNEIKKDKNLNIEFYRDIYNEDSCFLEVCSAMATKATGVEYIKNNFGFQRTVCFGDNTNDLNMFNICDECYAVSNARDELKQVANGVIKSNLENGVTEYLKTLYQF